jgi:hypothetical protein
MLSDYHEKQAQKVIRYTELSEKNEKRAEQVRKQADDMLSVIPFGQPILVGHYSEQRDRNYRNRAFNKIGKSIELSDKAKYYAHKVATIENNKSISSDNPDALELLREKINKIVDKQEHMKDVNKIVNSKKKNIEQKKKDLMYLTGYNEIYAERTLTEKDCFGNLGYAQYELTNNNANIRRLKDRFFSLEKTRGIESKEEKIGDITISDSTEDNRIMIFFPGIPSEKIRTTLKSCGFRWSPNNGCWQAYQNNRARDNVERIIKPMLVQ